MLGMSVTSFVVLLIISAVSAFIVHNVLKLGMPGTGEGYLSKLIVGWIGGWIGSPVVGYWGPSVPGANVYWIPAFIGSLGTIYMCVISLKMVVSLAQGVRAVHSSGERTKAA